MTVEYRTGDAALPPADFLALAQRVWPRAYNAADVAAALARTRNAGAWAGGRLVGAVRVLTDGYLFSVVPEILVDPDYQGRGIGRALMVRALALAPGGRLFLGAQPGREGFFERVGFRPGPAGYVAHREPPAAGRDAPVA